MGWPVFCLDSVAAVEELIEGAACQRTKEICKREAARAQRHAHGHEWNKREVMDVKFFLKMLIRRESKQCGSRIIRHLSSVYHISLNSISLYIYKYINIGPVRTDL